MLHMKRRKAAGGAALAALFAFATLGLPLVHPFLHCEAREGEDPAAPAAPAEEHAVPFVKPVRHCHGAQTCPVCVFLSNLNTERPIEASPATSETPTGWASRPVFSLLQHFSYSARSSRAPPA
jgi:hypothetical protein